VTGTRVCFALGLVLLATAAPAYDLHGRSSAPIEARRLKNPLTATAEHLESGRRGYESSCAGCHGPDGKARTGMAWSLPVRPADLSHYLMDFMRDGEIYWVVSNGNEYGMPAFASKYSDEQRWELVLYVRDLRRRQHEQEIAALGPYQWDLPPGFPFPNVPADNLMTVEKVKLGRYLFYDRRLSYNQTQSCASCHKQELAFSDGRARAQGSTGQLNSRSAMSLVNVAYSPVLTWANPNLRSLEQQVLVPLFGEAPVELGMAGHESLLMSRLAADAVYRRLFAQAFPGVPEPFTVANLAKAIACFERTISSGDSPYDEYLSGDDRNAISDAAKRGEQLFYSEKMECHHCHNGFTFSADLDYFGKGFPEVQFQNNGLYNLTGRLSYPDDNPGIFEFTRRPEDVGKFKPPGLRNIAVTAPYMHDGSIATLRDVIEHYAAGGQPNPNRSEFVKPLDVSEQDKTDILAFLVTLTGRKILCDPRLSDPGADATKKKCQPPEGALPVVGQVVEAWPDDDSVLLRLNPQPKWAATDEIEFLVLDREDFAKLGRGRKVAARVRRRGRDMILLDIEPGKVRP
jgi:cytochrome c peroxidase